MSEPRDSLTDRLARRAVRGVRIPRAFPAFDLHLACAAAAVVALAPLSVIVGAHALRTGVEAENRALKAQLDTRLAPQAARRAAGGALRDAVRAPALTRTLERLAQTLPDDARVVSAMREAGGRVQVEIAVSDPDVLRGALRRDPALAALQESGQRRTPDARVVVTLRSRP